MYGFLVLSAGLHGLAGLGAVLWWLPVAPPRGEVPATIMVVFGDNADRSGARPVHPPPVPRPAPPAKRAPVPPAPAPTAAPVQTQPAAAAGVPSGPHVDAAQAPSEQPVRLGDGEAGLKLDAPPDPGMIESPEADPSNRAPRFPDIAYAEHQYGRVVLRMHVDVHGRVSTIEVLQSSGHPLLDRVARDALAKWRFIPPLRDGVAMPSFRDQEINFVPD